MPTLVPVILGSRDQCPSMLHATDTDGLFEGLFGNDKSMFEATLATALSLAKPSNVISILPNDKIGIAYEQLANTHLHLQRHILLESDVDNDIALLATAAHYAMDNFTDPVLWVLPIHQTAYYTRILKNAITYSTRPAFEGAMILFALKPFKMDKRYAYMLSGDTVHEFDRLQQLRMYIPHPSENTPIWEQDCCCAHSSIFLTSPQTLLANMDKDMQAASWQIYQKRQESQFGQALDSALIEQVKSQSIPKFLGLLAQKSVHPLVSYKLPADTSKQNSWYQIWQHSQNSDDKGLASFLRHLERVA